MKRWTLARTRSVPYDRRPRRRRLLEFERRGIKPDGRRPVPGVTDTEILLGTHMPLSNTPAAAWAVIADGMKAYFEYINSQGGVYGRKIKLIVGDDHYARRTPSRSCGSWWSRTASSRSSAASATRCHLAVMQYLEEKGVPDLFIGGGMPQLH